MTPNDSLARSEADTTPAKIRVPRTSGRPRTTPDTVAAEEGYSNGPSRQHLLRRGMRHRCPRRPGPEGKTRWPWGAAEAPSPAWDPVHTRKNRTVQFRLALLPVLLTGAVASPFHVKAPVRRPREGLHARRVGRCQRDGSGAAAIGPGDAADNLVQSQLQILLPAGPGEAPRHAGGCQSCGSGGRGPLEGFRTPGRGSLCPPESTGRRDQLALRGEEPSAGRTAHLDWVKVPPSSVKCAGPQPVPENDQGAVSDLL